MAEYIDRAAAVKSVLRMRRPENSVAQNRMLSIIQMDMLKLPAADVVPVVRCKDCKYNVGTKKCLNPDSFFAVPKDDDFCSYGERKEGAE
jgi:hypothetical protein